jgi:hypothetical protein
VTERLGSMVKNRLEEIWVSVREIQGEANVELRVHGRSVSGKEEPLPGREAITLPVGLLPVLLRVLTQAQDVLIKRGLIYTPSPAEAIVVEDGLPITVRMADAAAGRKSRLYPRMSLSVPVECRVIDPDSFWPAKPVNGEAKDVSIGGAQVWLSKPLPRFKQVEVFMVIEGMPFRARAEIAGVELEAKKEAKSGYYRHSLRWVTMEAHAKEVLSKVVPGI